VKDNPPPVCGIPCLKEVPRGIRGQLHVAAGTEVPYLRDAGDAPDSASGFSRAMRGTPSGRRRRARAPDDGSTHGVGATSVSRSLSARQRRDHRDHVVLARGLLPLRPMIPCRPTDAAVRVSQRRGRHRRDGSAGGACGRRSGAFTPPTARRPVRSARAAGIGYTNRMMPTRPRAVPPECAVVWRPRSSAARW
jgi:hypothetical protein